MTLYTILIAWFGAGVTGALCIRIYWKRVWGETLPLTSGECVMMTTLGPVGLITGASWLYSHRHKFKEH